MKKVLFISIMVMLVMALVLPACAPAAPAKPAETKPATPPATTTPATPPAATTPATTPPATPPAATPAVTEVKTSFEAATYTSDSPGFSVQYPKSWIKGDMANDVVFIVLASSAQGADVASIVVIPETSDFGKAAKDSFDNDPALKNLGVKVNVDSTKTTTLADGKTPANEALLSAKIMGIYDLWGYCYGANIGGKTVFVTGATLAGDKSKALLQEIAKTLTLK